MATSLDPRPPTYHVVPRFDIAAEGGALQLGTVVDSLSMLRPLNRGKVVPISENLRYKPVTYNSFTGTWSRLREGHGSIWAKAFMLQGGISASASDDLQPTVTCDALITAYFDPDEGYVARSLASPGVDAYLNGSNYKEDVYLITGLKVAKKLRYGSTSSTQRQFHMELAVKEPKSGSELEATAGHTANDGHTVNFEADDIVVGFRVRRYAYVRSSLNIRRKKKLQGDDYLEGAQMHGENGEETSSGDSPYKELLIPEEQKAHDEAADFGYAGDEIWVGSSEQ